MNAYSQHMTKCAFVLTTAIFLLCLSGIASFSATITYTYDSAGRLTKADYQTNVITFTYDKVGNLLSKSYAVGPKALSLSQGWNLISLPLKPANTSITTVLADISGQYSIVWGDFNPTTQQWKFKTSAGGGLLNSMSEEKAYWVYITDTNGGTITVAGSQIEHNITLKPGWNFVGYNKTVENLTATVTNSITGNFSIIWGDFNPTTQQWKFKTSAGGGLLNKFETGKGYWIYNSTSNDVAWTIP